MSDAGDTRSFGGARPLRGRARVPGDKSISHRALLFAAMADGESTLTHVATGADVRATAHALGAVGVAIERPDRERCVVRGCGIDGWTEADAVIDCENSGTSMRMLAGALAGRPFLSVLTGDASLRTRPMARVVEPLRAMGATIDGRAGATLAPLVVRGGPLHGIRYELPVATAQVKSAIVLAGLQATGTTEVISPGQSRDHTERMLAALGAPVTTDGLTVRVEAGAPEPFSLEIPGDPSSAAFFAVAAAITPGSDLVIEGMSANPTRVGFVDVLARMGADIELVTTGEACGEPVGELRVRASKLEGTSVSGAEIANVIDEIPVLAVAAAFAEGVTEIREAHELLVKESNRIAALASELGALGAAVEPRPDGLLVRGGVPLAGGTLSSHGDHRIAMAMAVAANAINETSIVHEWSAVTSSYPAFADDFARCTTGT